MYRKTLTKGANVLRIPKSKTLMGHAKYGVHTHNFPLQESQGL